jgi:hypothetical protein
LIKQLATTVVVTANVLVFVAALAPPMQQSKPAATSVLRKSIMSCPSL